LAGEIELIVARGGGSRAFSALKAENNTVSQGIGKNSERLMVANRFIIGDEDWEAKAQGNAIARNHN
jgi:ABC-type tungstate transport system permease subunit